MHFKGSLAMFLVVLLFLVGVVAGCGGSDQQGTGGKTSGGQSQQSASGGSNGGTGQETKIAVGKIANVASEKRRFAVRPAKGETINFKAVPKVRIKLDDKGAELADMKKGQQVQLEYVVREEMGVPNRARSITLFSDGAAGGRTN